MYKLISGNLKKLKLQICKTLLVGTIYMLTSPYVNLEASLKHVWRQENQKKFNHLKWPHPSLPSLTVEKAGQAHNLPE